MLVFSQKELLQKVIDSEKDSFDLSIENTIDFLDVNLSKKSIFPSLIIATTNGDEIIIRYNDQAKSFHIDIPDNSTTYRTILKNAENIKNAEVKQLIIEKTKNLKGYTPLSDIDIDSIGTDKVLDMINAAKAESKKDILRALIQSSANIVNMISSQKKEVEKNNVKLEEGNQLNKNSIGQISEEDYPEYCKKKIFDINKKMDEMWRNLQYDEENEIQEEIISRFGEGQSIILMGDSGIGKSYNPEEISKKNNLHYSNIKFHSGTDSVELIGKTSFRSNPFTGQQEMYYDYGHLAEAFKSASARAYKDGSGSVIILDEVLVANDITSLISNLSINEFGEYEIPVDESSTFAKIQTDKGEFWFYVNSDIDRLRQPYSLDSRNNVSLEYNDVQRIFLFDGSETQAATRHFRGELLSIHAEDFRKILNENRKIILNTYSEKTKIFTPARAVSIVGTGNIGEKYEANLNIAVFSRMNPVYVNAPDIKYMVRKTIQSISNMKQWSANDIKKIEKIISNFSLALHKIFQNSNGMDISHNINFRILSNIIGAISPNDPFGDNKWSVKNVLERSSTKFSEVDPSVCAAEAKENPIVEIVRNGAQQAVELSNNPAFKGVKEDILEQNEPEEDETQIGMKI